MMKTGISEGEVIWDRQACESVGGTQWGAERWKTQEGKWKFVLTKRGPGVWYDHYGMGEYDTVIELNRAIVDAVARKNGRPY